MTHLEKIGFNVRKYRKEKDLSLFELASKVGVTKSTIHRIETGLVDCSTTTMIKIAEALNIGIDILLDTSKVEDEPKIFKIPVSYSVWGIVEVEAKNEEELLLKLKDCSFVSEMPLPYHPEYVEDSYEIDFESIDCHNKGATDEL